MKIEVTQEDINHGQKKSCTACPIALALQRQLAPALNLSDSAVIKISQESIELEDMTRSVFVYIEDVLSRADAKNIETFIYGFDKYSKEDQKYFGASEPMSFDLPLQPIMDQLNQRVPK